MAFYPQTNSILCIMTSVHKITKTQKSNIKKKKLKEK